LTRSLTASLSQSLLRTISAISTKEITTYLTPSLTHAIAPAVTQALRHSPESDYYCFYCHSHQVYCDECRRAEMRIRNDDYFAHYYSKYYSKYFSHFYGGIYADQLARDAVASPHVVFADPKEKRKLKEFAKYNWTGPELSAPSLRHNESESSTSAKVGS